MLRVLEGPQVDVIEPFPSAELRSAAGWMHCYKTLVFGDDGPHTNEEILEFLQLRLPLVRSWGIVDKHNLTRTKSEAPLVGIVVFERGTKYNGYIHLASNRRAWGEKIAKPSLIDQATPLILEEIFSSTPELQRISVATFAKNNAARSLARRAGFVKDGYFPAMGRAGEVPQDVIHYGLMRPQGVEVSNGLGQ